MAGYHRFLHRAGKHKVPLCLRKRPCDAQPECLQGDARAWFDEGDSEESFAICALLHDVCKSQFYKTSTRNVKNDETGQWEKRPFYTVDDAFPFGHGEKSVYLIERFMRLKPVEAMAIRWHMGGFDDAAKGGSFAISLAFDRYPLAVKLHMADLESTYLREKGTSDVR